MEDRTFPSSRSIDIARRFGYELRRRRTLAGLTQRQLADRVKYSREMVAAVERGRRYGSEELAVRCDEALGTGGALTRMWPLVECEQIAADRRRGPRPMPSRHAGRRERATGCAAAGPGRRSAPAVSVSVTPVPVGRVPAEWADWAERIRPAIGKVPPELAVQLRDLIDNLVMASTRDSA
jgi:transcriptional regulator with XRE-family HTH domain